MIRWVNDPTKVHLAMCGEMQVGAVFSLRPRRFTWRAFITKSRHPAEGHKPDLEAAKREVESRFNGFLELAKLRSIE